ncbi:MAG: methyltransferase domain-containing protein [Dehalococcoidales bacterium]|nr:methyltransferase domain-containing protein [Dehalococcoidales bacterium]
MEITHSYEGLGQEYFKARKGTPKFAAFVVSHAGPVSIQDRTLTILELGVGSGQQTEFVEKQLDSAGISRYKILAYDKSSDQLALLKERIKKGEISSRVILTQYDFDGKPLPLEAESIDFTYMAWVLHHLHHQQAVIGEVARTTRKGGGFFMYQVTRECMQHHPLDEFFPMKYEYDKQRYPTLPQLRRMFLNAGFTFERPHIIKDDGPRLIDRAFLEGVANTTIDSVLRIIKDNDPSAFSEGVNRLRLEVENSERSGEFRKYMHVDRSIFWGIKK